MSKNTKQTSSKVATLASETLLDKQASQIAKSLAASALVFPRHRFESHLTAYNPIASCLNSSSRASHPLQCTQRLPCNPVVLRASETLPCRSFESAFGCNGNSIDFK